MNPQIALLERMIDKLNSKLDLYEVAIKRTEAELKTLKKELAVEKKKEGK